MFTPASFKRLPRSALRTAVRENLLGHALGCQPGFCACSASADSEEENYQFFEEAHPLIFVPKCATGIRYQALASAGQEQEHDEAYIARSRKVLADIWFKWNATADLPLDLFTEYFRLETERWMLGNDAAQKKARKAATEEFLKNGRREKIKGIASHSSIPVMALSTSSARIYIFDLRAGKFLDYYLSTSVGLFAAPPLITSLTFGPTNQLAVGLSSGCIDLWTLNLSSKSVSKLPLPVTPIFSSPIKPPTPKRPPPRYYSPDTNGSPFNPYTTSIPRETLSPLKTVRDGVREKATSQPITLLPAGLPSVDDLLGGVTTIKFSASGKLMAVASSKVGIWIYNILLDTSTFLYAPLRGTTCTCLSWDPPFVPHPGNGKRNHPGKFPGEGNVALVAGMSDGLIVYFRLHEFGSSIYIAKSANVEFYPRDHLGQGQAEGGIKNLLSMPLPRKFSGNRSLHYPSIILSNIGSPYIHIFRLISKSVGRASVTSPSACKKGAKESSGQFYYKKLAAACCLENSRPEEQDLIFQLVESIDTSFGPFRPAGVDTAFSQPTQSSEENKAEASSSRSTPSGREKQAVGYGGIPNSFDLDPTGTRFFATFSHQPNPEGKEIIESAVWFDSTECYSLGAGRPLLKAIRVVNTTEAEHLVKLRNKGRIGEVALTCQIADDDRDEMDFAAVVVDGGKAVAFFGI